MSASRPLRSCEILPVPTKDSPESWERFLTLDETRFRDWNLPSTAQTTSEPFQNQAWVIAATPWYFCCYGKTEPKTNTAHASVSDSGFIPSTPNVVSDDIFSTRTVPNRPTDLSTDLCKKQTVLRPVAMTWRSRVQISLTTSRLPCPQTCQTRPSPVCLSQSSCIVSQVFSTQQPLICKSTTTQCQSAQLTYPILCQQVTS